MKGMTQIKIAAAFAALGLALTLASLAVPASLNVLVSSKHTDSGSGTMDVRSYVSPHRLMQQTGTASLVIGGALLLVAGAAPLAARLRSRRP